MPRSVWAALLAATASSSALKSNATSAWRAANPAFRVVDSYQRVFAQRSAAHRARLGAGAPCHFLDVGGRYGESRRLAGGCAYWIVDVNRVTSARERVLGCDIEAWGSCRGAAHGGGALPRFDVLHSQNTFEHLRMPWEALRTMGGLARRGALLLLAAPFAWRYHAVQVPARDGASAGGSYGDYLRYTADELAFLAERFGNFSALESGYDERQRRTNQRGTLPSRTDGVREDALGGWLESIEAFYVGQKR